MTTHHACQAFDVERFCEVGFDELLRVRGRWQVMRPIERVQERRGPLGEEPLWWRRGILPI